MNTFIAIANKGEKNHPCFKEFAENSNSFFWSDSYFRIECNVSTKTDLSLFFNDQYVIAIDGEIYNLQELNSNLSIVYTSPKDSELFLHLLSFYSEEEICSKLQGQFAILIYDRVKKEISLIKDVFGSKPVYYGICNNGVLIGSRFDAIFKHSYFENKGLRPEIMKEYLSFGYMHAPNTIFKNIFQVEAAQIVKWNIYEKTISKKEYFKWENTEQFLETDIQTAEVFDTIFKKVIRHSVKKGSKLTSFLSGGIDSPLVTSYLSDVSSDVNSFTLEINNKRFNESRIASEYARILNVKHHIKNIKENEITTLVEKHFKILSEPIGDYSSVASYFMAKAVKEYTDTVFSGDGGDELFWGYPRFLKPIAQAHWFYLPLFLRKILVPPTRKFNSSLSYVLEDRKYFHDWIRHSHSHLDTDLLMPGISFSDELKDSYFYDGSLNSKDILYYLKKNETKNHLQRILKKTDLTGRPVGLTIQSPFLNTQILEFSNALIPELHKHKNPKYILKKLLAQRTNENLVSEPKRGFSFPLDSWLEKELKEDVIHTLLEIPFYGEEFLDKSILKQWIHDFFSGKKTVNSWGIWHLYSWQKWAKQLK